MNAFRNLKVAHKLLAATAGVLVLTIFLGLFSMAKLSEINRASEDISRTWTPAARMLLEMKFDAAGLRSESIEHILSESFADMTQSAQAMDKLKARLAENQRRIEPLMRLPAQRELYGKFQQAQASYLRDHDRYVKLSQELMKDEARQVMRGEAAQSHRRMTDLLGQLGEVTTQAGDEALAQSEQGFVNARRWILGVLLGSVVLGVLFSLRVAALIARPLRDAVRVARTVAAGDLSSRIEVQGKDETAELLGALKAMNDNLARVVGDVRRGTDNIATASREIAAGNMDLSSRTEQQASSLEETAASMEELTSTVKQNAQNAQQADQLAASAFEVARQGAAAVQRVVDTMASIHTASHKIVDIISVIDGIAFQTNILALNAAVEAARAGEQGRGFAVVASEVRSLAQRSAEAARQIKGLIDDSVSQVSRGGQEVAEAGRTMQEIEGRVTRVADIMGEITAASREQSLGIEQVNRAIAQMDEVTQQNAALVEEAAAAAGSMQDQAGVLVQAVSVFRLDRDTLDVPAKAHRPGSSKAVPTGLIPLSA